MNTNLSTGNERSWVRTAYPVAKRAIKCRLYIIWSDMRVRCNNPKSVNYPWYGAKGVRVCAEWDDYAVFRAWAIAKGYRKDLTLDRERSDGDYEPGNCRWATRQEQQTNTGRTIMLTLNSVTRSLPEWARALGFTKEALRTRRSNGWTDEQILTTPPGAARIGYVPKPRGRKPKSFQPSGDPK